MSNVHENPLLPNKKLRQIYQAMAEARALDEHFMKLPGRNKSRCRLDSIRGQEACRIGTAIDLRPGDLVSDSRPRVVMERLAGEKINSLVRRAEELCSTRNWTAAGGRRLLPWIENPGERLRLAMGAALAFKISGRNNVVVVYVLRGSVSRRDWGRVLSLASKLELPLIFVVLSSIRGEKSAKKINLSDKARQFGVPGIPVDAGDAMALFRVAQESLGRIRCGDGPVLIECLGFPWRNREDNDPLIRLRDSLIARKICTRSWLRSADRDIRRRIEEAIC